MVRCSSMPSAAVATSPSRTTRPLRSDTTSCMKSSGVCKRPCRRMVRSSSALVTRPTGTARLPACSAAVTCGTLTPAACNRCGSRLTVSSRFTPPDTCTSATPAIERSSRVMPGSAICVSCAGVSDAEYSDNVTIGASVGLNFLRIGSSISCGKSWRFVLMASRMSCVASERSFEYTNCVTICAKPSRASPLIDLTPEMLWIASSIGSSTSRSTCSGDAPG